MSDYSFKVAVAGRQAVGKTALISRFTNNKFSDGYKKTMGVKKLLFNYNSPINLLIYELGGHPKLKMVKYKIFKNSLDGLILVYDLMRPSTLNELEHWIRVNKENNENHEKCRTILVGNKLDTYIGNEVMEESLSEFLKSNEEVKAHYKTSAKTGENVKKAFKGLISLILENEANKNLWFLGPKDFFREYFDGK